MSLSKLEKETIINFNEEEEAAEIYTYNVRLQNRLEKISLERPEDVKLVCVDGRGEKTYRLPKKYVSVRPTRKISKEDRERMAQAARDRFFGNGKSE
ncbi:MAG: molecular chaperone [Lachnospiraceae bacterium]|jgi:hypothetical protein